MLCSLGLAEFLEEPTPLGKSDVGLNGNIIIGGFVGIALGNGEVDPWDEDASKLQTVNSLDAKCLLEHFNYRFPNMARFKDWHEPMYSISQGMSWTHSIYWHVQRTSVSVLPALYAKIYGLS